MVVDPATAMLLAGVITAGASAVSSKMSANKAEKASKLRSNELKRETRAGRLNEAYKRKHELLSQKSIAGNKRAQRKNQIADDTSTLLRKAFGL